MKNVYRRRKGEIKAISPVSFKRKPDPLLTLAEKIWEETGYETVALTKTAFGRNEAFHKRPHVRYPQSAPLFGKVK